MSEVKMDIKMATKDLCAMLEKLQTGLLHDLNEPQNISHEEAGAVADMIKDLAEAKEKMVKCIYYEKITEAMEESEYDEDYDEDGPIEKSGYRGRNRRTGRFVSRGMGAGRGYGYPDYMMPLENYRMGYRDAQESQRMNGNSMDNTAGTNGSNGNEANGNNRNYTPSRHGMAYDNYQNARRYYTENPTEENKMTMKSSWDDAVDDAIQALKKMYMDAEPMMKRKVNEKVTRALQEMPPA